MESFAKGKRGVIFLTTYRGKAAVIKKHNPDASIDTIRNEAVMLEVLNKHGIGPKFFTFKSGELTREFIEGEPFLEYLEKQDKKEVVRVLEEIFYQCRKIDLLGINKFELTRPYKHILITTQANSFRGCGAVVQIDFERCKYTEKPKNVTQFLQCVVRGRIQALCKEKNIPINTDKLLDLGKDYKHKLDIFSFEEIICAIGARPRAPNNFVEKVYDVCARVPKGKVINYKGIARTIGTQAYQAIGQALKRNPYAPRIPCHRVVKGDGTIGGFMGATTGKPIEKKLRLLKEEEVLFDEKNRIKDAKKIIEKV